MKIKGWKTWLIVLFTLLCLGLNIAGRWFSSAHSLPLWLDSFGTALCAYLAGPVCGAAVGFASNLIFVGFNQLSVVYALTSVALGFIVGVAARRRLLSTFYGAMMAASLAIAVAVAVSLPLNLIFADGYTGNVWGDALIDYLLSLGWAPVICCFLGQLALEFADKLLILLALYLLVQLNAWRTATRAEGTPVMKSAAVLLLAGLLLSAAAPASAGEEVDYNDYVQTVYSSTNGLPCGEANAIAQTSDGVLWVGTYAGLYRYNGREFRWIDSFDSIRNVNCLYVDMEGRLWVGTNDNGLSILIREQVTNVIDHTHGLSSDSVRCVIQSADGYYYVGTTSSMQLLQMSNGLKIANTLREVNYADTITADEAGHVAATCSDGRLFLMQRGQVLSSLRLTDGEGLFTCCAFAPDGTLMAGSSAGVIYRYDISGGAFEPAGERVCDGVVSINSLSCLDDGTLFISADNGVCCVDPEGGYHRINTNAFNNSIDHMLADYQGNLWFTSSRLGLLRLARSAFRDVYGTIGMERRVVNTIVRWRDTFCIGTDKGLDMIDTACRRQLTCDLTARLNGLRIRCMYVDAQEHLWICTYGSGLWEVAPDDSIWLYNTANGSFGDRARLVTGLRDGTILAAGDTGLCFIRDHRIERVLRYEDGLVNPMILTVTELSDGTILAGTDGDGIAVIRDRQVTGMLTRDDGLSSGVILRTIADPGSEGVFVVTSNGLCYLQPDMRIRPLRSFPYFNNYDIWARDEETLFVMSSAGIYVVSRDDLAADTPGMACELLDARAGLTSAITANSWNWSDGEGTLYLPCDTGVYVINAGSYSGDNRTYRMQLVSLLVDGVPQPRPQSGVITIEQGASRVELRPEILNYTIQEPTVGYRLEGFDTRWTILPQSSLGSVIYTNLPAGQYTFRLAVFDQAGENILEEQSFAVTKVGELYEQPIFTAYIMVLLVVFIIWFTWLVVQRQLNRQQIKLNMANETVLAIANAVDAKDVRTSQHSARVAEYSVLIAREMGCFNWWQRRKKLLNLKNAARMHDIGKIGIHDAVLNKVGRLTDEEYGEMKSHVVQGGDILKDFTLVENVALGARYHHERWDGRGYPDGLKGEQIPLYGRIIAVADAFDAMTSNRVYRNQMDTDYVMNEMRRGRGTQFDPEALDAFLRLVDKGIINLEEIYAQRSQEIVDQQHQAATARRAEEDKKIQAESMKSAGGEGA